MKVISNRWTQCDSQRLAIGTIGITLCLFVLVNCLTRGAVATTILFTDTNDNYMDFFNSLIDASYANPYTERNVIYPPLCYLLYRAFGTMIPATYYPSGSFYIRGTMAGMFSFGCYMALSLGTFCFFAIKFEKKLKVDNPLLTAANMISAPMLYALQRGNFIILTVACLMAFLCYKDDSSSVKRHFAFLMLAVAANLKMYPAVFGLLLVTEKRWRDCFFCILYGVALFILPMMCFGDLSNILVLIGNITRTTDKFGSSYGSRTDLGNLLGFLSVKGVFRSLFSFLQGKMLVLGTCLMLLCYVCMDTELHRIMCLTIICTFIPGFSYMYNLLYLIPLLLIAVRQNNRQVFVLILATMLYYPIDISGLPLVQLEGMELIPRLWDLIASLSGAVLFGYTVVIAAKMLVVKAISRKTIAFHTHQQKQILFNARIDA